MVKYDIQWAYLKFIQEVRRDRHFQKRTTFIGVTSKKRRIVMSIAAQ